VSARTDEPVTRLAIDLPLPLDMVGTVMGLIGAAYPTAKLDTRGGHQLVALIPESARARKVSKKAAEALKEPAPDDPTENGDLASINADGSFGLIPHEEVRMRLAEMMARVLDADGGAGENYIEWAVHDLEDPSNRYVLYAARSRKQTPHALRQRAEADLAAARAEVEQLRAEVAGVRAQK
jgi:hypothetical protein